MERVLIDTRREEICSKLIQCDKDPELREAVTCDVESGGIVVDAVVAQRHHGHRKRKWKHDASEPTFSGSDQHHRQQRHDRRSGRRSRQRSLAATNADVVVGGVVAKARDLPDESDELRFESLYFLKIFISSC